MITKKGNQHFENSQQYSTLFVGRLSTSKNVFITHFEQLHKLHNDHGVV